MEEANEGQLVSDDMLEDDRLRYEKEVSKYLHSRAIVLGSIKDIFPEEPPPVAEYLSRLRAELEYDLKRKELSRMLDAPSTRSLEIHEQLREMEAQRRAKTRIAKRSRTRSDKRSRGNGTTKPSPKQQRREEDMRTEQRSLQQVMDEVLRKIRTLKEPAYPSHYLWNRVYKLNETLDTLLKMRSPSRLPMKS
jgi:hypothetical protein